ncbi:hypothetical protein T09_5951 [Trichinella sp. T9]|nr:hypothetical protein T09_5951 [Trichinella sp. T9]
MLLELVTLLAGSIIKRAGFITISDVPTKIASLYNFLQYLNKFAFVRRKQPIWNSLETALGWLKCDIGDVFCITVRYSLKLQSAVQYFFVLGKSIFLHFPSIWNKFIEIVSGRFEMPIKSSIY